MRLCYDRKVSCISDSGTGPNQRERLMGCKAKTSGGLKVLMLQRLMVEKESSPLRQIAVVAWPVLCR